MAILTGIIASIDMRKTTIVAFIILLLGSCATDNFTVNVQYPGLIYPDYMDVTIPSEGIAPLNFCYVDAVSPSTVTTFTCGDETVRIKGRSVRWNEREWKRLTASAAGKDIVVTTTAADTSWVMHVSGDSIDYGLTYRLIEPGYEIYSKMGIYERNLSDFSQRPLIENTEFDGCVNCHSFNRCVPDDLSLHIRGEHGATLLRLDGKMQAYNTKTDSTLGFCVYPFWHPSGKYIAYSTNKTKQGFHVRQEKLIEVFDNASDLQIYDIAKNELITAQSVKMEGVWETFPAFSADGGTLYFCRAQEQVIPQGLDRVSYNLCKVSFDAQSGAIGDSVEVVVDAASMGKSISFPRPTFDGRFLVYVLSDYGNFSIWHHEADLWVLDLATGATRSIEEVNSDDTESYHSFSGNSRWMVFSSRRDDGLHTRPYFAHVGKDGTFGKPFMLPQKDPRRYYEELFFSYNIPEFVTAPVRFDRIQAQKLINSSARIPFGFRWSD